MATIRKATLKDLQVIQELDRGLFVYEKAKDQLINTYWPFSEEGRNFLVSILTFDHTICFLAEEEGQAVGFLTGMLLSLDTKRPMIRSQLLNLYIDQSHRRQGVGEALVEEFISWSKTRKVDRILLSAAAVNTNALLFYKKLGFEEYQILFEKKI